MITARFAFALAIVVLCSAIDSRKLEKSAKSQNKPVEKRFLPYLQQYMASLFGGMPGLGYPGYGMNPMAPYLGAPPAMANPQFPAAMPNPMMMNQQYMARQPYPQNPFASQQQYPQPYYQQPQQWNQQQQPWNQAHFHPTPNHNQLPSPNPANQQDSPQPRTAGPSRKPTKVTCTCV